MKPCTLINLEGQTLHHLLAYVCVCAPLYGSGPWEGESGPAANTRILFILKEEPLFHTIGRIYFRNNT